MTLSIKTSNGSAIFAPLPDTALTRGGTRFDPRENLWEWVEGVFKIHLNFSRLPLSPEVLLSFKATLLSFAKTASPSHLTNMFNGFKHFIESRNGAPTLKLVDTTEVSNYAAQLSQKNKWRLGALNVVLQRWVTLGLEGVDPNCAVALEERRKPGNEKGAAVRTRDPVAGPFSEAEFKALYKAVDVAYGQGQIPRWVVVLTRLLYACGGRIAQYASLKSSDLKPHGAKFVLSLPQAKTREQHSRESFNEFNLSPQTLSLLLEHIDHLADLGYDSNAALFPSGLVSPNNELKDFRILGDQFEGHCTAKLLSSVFAKSMNGVAPSTERLNYEPMPVNPKRFRYTFATRLVEEGASRAVVADRLGHTDLQNVEVYYEASPKIVENIDKAMDAMLAPLANAFRGRLIKDEGQSTHKGAPGSRIIDFRISSEPIASCAGKGQGCSFNKPVACYSCYKFEPWLDAPHEKVLARLEAEREKHAGDERIAMINDDAIHAVRQVIAECAQVRDQSSLDGSEGAK